MSKRSPAEPPPEFFVDRSLGSAIVPAALRAAGLTVHALVDVYPKREDVDDETWIAESTAKGWVLLTKDRAIRRNQAEREAVARAGARMFCIPSASLTAAEMGQRFVDNRHRIIQHARKAGPYIYLVHRERLELVFAEG